MESGYKTYNNYSQQDKDSMRTYAANTSNENEATIINGIAVLQAKLDSIAAQLEVLEEAIVTVQEHIDTVNTSVNSVKGSVDTVNTSLDTVNTSVNNVKGAVDIVNTSVAGVTTAVNTQGGQIVSAIEALPHTNAPETGA